MSPAVLVVAAETPSHHVSVILLGPSEDCIRLGRISRAPTEARRGRSRGSRPSWVTNLRAGFRWQSPTLCKPDIIRAQHDEKRRAATLATVFIGLAKPAAARSFVKSEHRRAATGRPSADPGAISAQRLTSCPVCCLRSCKAAITRSFGAEPVLTVRRRSAPAMSDQRLDQTKSSNLIRIDKDHPRYIVLESSKTQHTSFLC